MKGHQLRRVMLIAVSAILWTAFGCTKSTIPKLYSVQGKITYKGALVEGANVLYRSVDGSASGGGRTDAGGNYRITSPWGAGLPEGEYLVTISKFEEVPLGEEEDTSPQLADIEAPPPKSLIPERYSRPEQSGLKVTVGKSGGTYDFELTD